VILKTPSAELSSRKTIQRTSCGSYDCLLRYLYTFSCCPCLFWR